MLLSQGIFGAVGGGWMQGMAAAVEVLASVVNSSYPVALC